MDREEAAIRNLQYLRREHLSLEAMRRNLADSLEDGAEQSIEHNRADGHQGFADALLLAIEALQEQRQP